MVLPSDVGLHDLQPDSSRPGWSASLQLRRHKRSPGCDEILGDHPAPFAYRRICNIVPGLSESTYVIVFQFRQLLFGWELRYTNQFRVHSLR